MNGDCSLRWRTSPRPTEGDEPLENARCVAY